MSDVAFAESGAIEHELEVHRLSNLDLHFLRFNLDEWGHNLVPEHKIMLCPIGHPKHIVPLLTRFDITELQLNRGVEWVWRIDLNFKDWSGVLGLTTDIAGEKQRTQKTQCQ